MRKISLISIFLFASLFLCFLLLSPAFSQIPHLINYQGKLTDPQGKPVPDGTHSLTFRIYDAESGGNLLWQETQNLLISKGVFSCLLGGVTNLNLAFDKPYWLAIKVGSDSEMTPRQQIASVGYAMRAERANRATVADLADIATNAGHAGQADNANTLGGKTANEISPIANFISGSYSGNGQPSRVINLGFTPDYVFVAVDEGSFRFYAMGTNYWLTGYDFGRDKNDGRWQGIVTNGFQCGSNPGDARNANRSGMSYTYIAIKQN